MARPSEILAKMPVERLRAVVETAPRKPREELFRQAGVRNRKSTFSLKGNDRSQRLERLHARLGERGASLDEAAEEVIRAYLAARPALLADALDHFGVAHQQGMTNADLDFLAQLETAQIEALWAELERKGHESEDVDLYCRYMDIPDRPSK